MKAESHRIVYRPHLIQNTSAFPEQQHGSVVRGKIKPRRRDEGSAPTPPERDRAAANDDITVQR